MGGDSPHNQAEQGRYTIDGPGTIPEYQFVRLIQKIMNSPDASNRTNVWTRTVCNQFLQFDLSGNKLPVTRLRKQYLRGIFNELMWFISGRTDLQYLHDRNLRIWDGNTATSGTEGFVGPIYGHQWRNFGAPYNPEARTIPLPTGTSNPEASGRDQLAYIIRELRENPSSRRIMLSSWCPPDIFTACLPPCHVSYNFNVIGKKLYCHITQRSSDVILALNWNVVSGAMLTHMLARIAGLEATEISIAIANAHIYEIHNQVAYEMLRDGFNVTARSPDLHIPGEVRMFVPEVPDMTQYTLARESRETLLDTDVVITSYTAPDLGKLEMVV
jgi:thymidylate synthase